MKSPYLQNSAPSHSNNFNAIDGLIIVLMIFFIITGVCLLAPVYFTTHFVLGLIKPADSKPASASSNQVENDELKGQNNTSQDASQMPECRVS